MFCRSCGNQIEEGLDTCPKCGTSTGDKKNKTKFGVSIGLVGAALFFLGIFNSLAVILLAAYILLFENSKWLKTAAVKAVTIMVAFTICLTLVSVLGYVFTVVNVVIGWTPIIFRLGYPLGIDTIINYVIYGLQDLLLIGLGLKALSQGSIAIKPIDKFITRHMD